MLRRNLLAVAAASVLPLKTMASSVVPLGYISEDWQACPPKYRWNGNNCEPTELQFGGPYYEWVAAVNSANMALGGPRYSNKPRPPAYAIVDIDNPWFRAQLSEGQFADLSHLRDLLTYGAAAGGSIGLRTRVGATVGAILGAEAGALLWMGYNLGVVIQRVNAATQIQPGSYVPITYNANYFNVSAGISSLGFPAGACYIDMMHGGSGSMYEFTHGLL